MWHTSSTLCNLCYIVRELLLKSSDLWLECRKTRYLKNVVWKRTKSSSLLLQRELARLNIMGFSCGRVDSGELKEKHPEVKSCLARNQLPGGIMGSYSRDQTVISGRCSSSGFPAWRWVWTRYATRPCPILGGVALWRALESTLALWQHLHQPFFFFFTSVSFLLRALSPVSTFPLGWSFDPARQAPSKSGIVRYWTSRGKTCETFHHHSWGANWNRTFGRPRYVHGKTPFALV